jgi:AcrR family transcriptional regulator
MYHFAPIVRRFTPARAWPEADPAPAPLPRGRHALPCELVADNQRDRLLHAVAHAVDELGYACASVAEITARAGVSRRTFYEHFRDREECFVIAFERIVDLLYADVANAYAEGTDWPERVENGLARLLHRLAAEPVFARIYASKSTAAGPHSLEARAQAVERFTAFVHAGGEHPGAEPQPLLLARVVVAGVGDVISGEVAAGRVERLPELLPDLLYAILLPYLGTSETGSRRALAARDLALSDDPD